MNKQALVVTRACLFNRRGLARAGLKPASVSIFPSMFGRLYQGSTHIPISSIEFCISHMEKASLSL